VLELAHETFSRRLSSGWGSELRSIVQVEPLGMDQMSYDDHIRSMPNPNVVLTVPVPPLPGSVIVDLDTQLAIQMVERLLGASPMPGVRTPRRPSEVESDLIAFLGRQAVAALADTLSPLLPVDPQLESVEYNPQLVQVAAPSDSALLLSYRVTISQGLDANGIVTIAYPSPTLTAGPTRGRRGTCRRRRGDDRRSRHAGRAAQPVAGAAGRPDAAAGRRRPATGPPGGRSRPWGRR
jgi:flagellar motor switch protein FliM